MKLISSCLFSFIVVSNSIIAQTLTKSMADSLWSIWSNVQLPDTTRLRAIQKYTWDGMLFNKPDSGFYFANLQYDFALKGDYKDYMAAALNSLGVSCRLRGNYQGAIEYQIKGLKLKEEMADEKGVASSLGNIGNIYASQGVFDKASHFYSKSLEVMKNIRQPDGSLGDKIGIARLIGNIGVIYKNLGELTKAIDCQIESLSYYELVNDKKGMGNALNNIGLIYASQGEYSKAIEYYDKSLALRKEISDNQGEAGAFLNLGLALHGIGHFDKAQEYYAWSLAIFEKLKDQKGLSLVYNNLGITLKAQMEFEKAIDCYTKCLNLGQQSGDKIGIALALLNIGNLQRITSGENKASTSLLQSYNLAVEVGVDELIRHSAKGLYLNNVALDKVTDASKYLSVLINRRNKNLQSNFFSLSEHEKQVYFATMEEDYGLYHEFALCFQDRIEKLTDTSYNIALQNKGLTLKSSTAMRAAIQNSGDNELINKYEEWLNLKRKLASLNETDSTYPALVNVANEIERQLVKQSNVFSSFEKVRSLRWQDVQSGLKSGEAAIEFVHFRTELDTAHEVVYAALIVKKDSKSPQMVRLCSEKEIIKVLGKYHGNNIDFVNSMYGTKDKLNNELYEKIWKPLEHCLENVKTVYFSPSGLLHKVAFHAIGKGKSLYLCDNFNLHQQSSTGFIALPNIASFQTNTSITLFGGVQYNTDTTANEVWTFLPGTLDETNRISSFLKKKKFLVTHLTDKNSTEENFKILAASANILHISTHGFFFPDPSQLLDLESKQSEFSEEIIFRGNRSNPDKLNRSTRYADWTFVKNKNPLMRSGLVLTFANDVWQRASLSDGEDGILTAQEVANLNLHRTGLVVLSACETGLGDILGSEGVYGLQRAFKMAGAKFLVMSLWQVPDKETTEFMTVFYGKLFHYQDIRKAFQETQRIMRKKYDPYFWAAFVLVE